MLERTFQLVPGIGPWREKDLWARGIQHWDQFPPECGPVAVSAEVDALARERIAQARQALERGQLATLAAMFPAREHWRLYPAFCGRAVFFDIEADADRVPTVVTTFGGEGIRVFIRDRNLDALPQALAGSELWVTFNGGSFDIPVLTGYFGELPRPALHLDLKVLMRKIRLGGGLKSVEDRLGIGRPAHLGGVGGFEAVTLWRAYQESHELEALRFLVEYNAYDAINLRTVAEAGYNRAAELLAFDDRVPVFERGEVLYDLSKLLLELGPTERDLRALERLLPRDVSR